MAPQRPYHPMITGAFQTGTHDIPRLRQPKSPYRSWASFDPYADNIGCTIRVSRRPSSLVRPPKVRPLEPREDVVLDLESPRTRAALTMLGLERADVDPEVAIVPSCRSLENCW